VGRRGRKRGDRLAHVLTVLMLAATGLAAAAILALLVNPALPFNPYPPPAALPLPDATAPGPVEGPVPTPTGTPVTVASGGATAGPMRLPLPTPTPLHPATLTPTPQANWPFSATIVYGPGPLLDCAGPRIAGAVSDRQGEPLRGYPLHVWGPGTEMIVRSASAPTYGPAGWVVSPTVGTEAGTWYVQLHLDSAYFAYRPLSAIVPVILPADCPQALVLFEEAP